MKEIIEFRITEVDARKNLPDHVGVPLGTSNFIRKVVVDIKDPLVTEISKVESKCRAEGSIFFTAWEIIRKYSDLELAKASLLKLVVKKVFEPAGEECETEYDDKTGNLHPICKFGWANQFTLLFQIFFFQFSYVIS